MYNYIMKIKLVVNIEVSTSNIDDSGYHGSAPNYSTLNEAFHRWKNVWNGDIKPEKYENELSDWIYVYIEQCRWEITL